MAYRHKRVFICAVCCAALLCSLVIRAAAAEQSTCEHQYSITIIAAATEDTDGQCRYTCDICGYTYTGPILRSGHIWSAWQVTKEPTCGAEGERMRVCTKYPNAPHYEYEVLPATGQHCFERRVSQEADCVYGGEAVYTCSMCGESYTEPIPPTGHDFGPWMTEQNATIFHAGLACRICADCGVTEEKVLQQLPGPNQTDYVLCSVLLAGTGVIGYPLLSAAQVLKWHRRKKQDFLRGGRR